MNMCTFVHSQRYYTAQILVVYSSKNCTSVIYAQRPFVLCSQPVLQACLVFVNYVIGISRINIIVFISSATKGVYNIVNKME